MRVNNHEFLSSKLENNSNFKIINPKPLKKKNKIISSSLIRKLISKGDLKKALRETCSRPDDLKPGCVRITSHAYNREDYWHFTCYNLDANDNLVTYQEKMIGRKQP